MLSCDLVNIKRKDDTEREYLIFSKSFVVDSICWWLLLKFEFYREAERRQAERSKEEGAAHQEGRSWVIRSELQWNIHRVEYQSTLDNKLS